MCFHIKQPVTDDEFSAYYKLRWQLLRAPWNQAKGSEVDNMEDQCFHVMAVDDKNNIVGVARLQFNSSSEAQIRYMAVANEHERKGIGRQLINAIEDHASTSSCKEIILDARKPAVDFYKKLGYVVIENSYLLFDEIQHFRMSKEL
ncbi:MAG: GNAT family N-acetyltransferase [Gammaproteobacteria bacterium]|nr:GNAT family N-acetyltransferase [Gammaproteobacteria bacterium]